MLSDSRRIIVIICINVVSRSQKGECKGVKNNMPYSYFYLQLFVDLFYSRYN